MRQHYSLIKKERPSIAPILLIAAVLYIIGWQNADYTYATPSAWQDVIGLLTIAALPYLVLRSIMDIFLVADSRKRNYFLKD